MFEFDFMRKAFLMGFCIAIIIPMIGTVMINSRNSMIGDALSHTALAGISFGLMIGINPVVGAVLVCLIAGLSVEILRNIFPKRSDLPTALVMSSGIGIAAILSDFVPGGTNLESFLFGSIVAIPKVEFFLVLVVSLLVLISFIVLYHDLIYIIFDEESARIYGIKTKFTNRFFTIITALTIAIASRTVGTLMISSLMVLPVATAMQLGKSFFQTVVLSSILAVLFMMIGLTISFYGGVKPGGAIVLIGLISLIISLFVKKLKK